MIARLICWWKGHRRGKRLTGEVAQPGFGHFQCPRCGARWVRKEKLAA